MNVVKTIAWLIPVYVANISATLSPFKLFPLDLGTMFWDGRRILGDGKTLGGFIFGVFSGWLTASFIYPLFSISSSPFFVSLGALLGDTVGSFFKRRMGFPRGAPTPVLDQLDFVVGAVLLGGLSDPYEVIFVLSITPLLHLLANYIGYRLGVKRVPW